MARDRLTYRQRDLNTALKVLKANDVPVARVDITADGVSIIAGTPEVVDDDTETMRTNRIVRDALKRSKNRKMVQD